LIGYTYMASNFTIIITEPNAFYKEMGDVWDKLTELDTNRFVGGGWYSKSALMAFQCTILQLVALDAALKKEADGFDRTNLMDYLNLYMPCNISIPFTFF
jgi:hypothetical protein